MQAAPLELKSPTSFLSYTKMAAMLQHSRKQYRAFLHAMEVENKGFMLHEGGEINPYALCFGIFGHVLLKDDEWLKSRSVVYSQTLRTNVRDFAALRSKSVDVRFDKSFLQLLCFSLSALYALGTLKQDPLDDIIRPLIPFEIEAHIERIKALEGKSSSGNLAMFAAILLIHAQQFLGIETQKQLNAWVELHLESMKFYGFWGGDNMLHQSFQNGYHQYEILEYLNVPSPRISEAVAATGALAGRDGHFGVFPGGTGCYDYDAVFILTTLGAPFDIPQQELLLNCAIAILGQQNTDGGFAESRFLRPLDIGKLLSWVRHIICTNPAVRRERARYFWDLVNKRHNFYRTHWSPVWRSWDTSDLWNSWFRMLAVARIHTAFSQEDYFSWGWLTYPGIGGRHNPFL